VKSILDPDFKYVPSFSTDIRETFRRAQRGELDQEFKVFKSARSHMRTQTNQREERKNGK
jgi:hypothetical protein